MSNIKTTSTNKGKYKFTTTIHTHKFKVLETGDIWCPECKAQWRRLV